MPRSTFEELRVEMGSYQRVTLDKLFGPTIFANLRITADADRGWVIERLTGPGGGGDVWLEWVTIPAQLDVDFEDEGEKKA